MEIIRGQFNPDETILWEDITREDMLANKRQMGYLILIFVTLGIGFIALGIYSAIASLPSYALSTFLIVALLFFLGGVHHPLRAPEKIRYPYEMVWRRYAPAI
jgi:hypothetical protein